MYFRQRVILAAIILLSQSLWAALPRAPYCVDYRIDEERILVVWYYEGVNQYCHLNDGNENDAYFFVHEKDWNNRAVARFDGIEADYPVESISLFIWGSDLFPHLPGGPQSPFGLSIFACFPDGAVGIPVWQEDSLVAGIGPPSGQWHSFPVHRRLPIEDTAYVQLRWLPETPAAPLLGVDYLPGVNYSSLYGYEQDSRTVWDVYYGGSFLIRLCQGLPDTLPELPPFSSPADSFSIFLGADSSDVRRSSQPHLVIRDSLHASLTFPEASAKFLAVAAWHGDRLGPKSEPRQLVVADTLPFPLQIEPESLVVHTEIGATVKAGINLTNTMPVALDLQMEIAEEDRVWLSLKGERDSLEAGEQKTVELTIDSRRLGMGDHRAAVWMVCTVANLFFADRSYQIHNHVDVSTATGSPTGAQESGAAPIQNQPNPFSVSTIIRSRCSKPIHVYNLLGKLVATIQHAGERDGGRYLFVWQGCDNYGQPVASGVYLYVQEGWSRAGKMLLLK